MVRHHRILLLTLCLFFGSSVHLFGQLKSGKLPIKVIPTSSDSTTKPSTLNTNSDSIPVLVTDSTVALKNDLDEEVIAECADSIIFDLESGEVHLWRNASVDYGSIHLKAGHLIINRTNKTLLAEGIDSAGKTIQTPVFKDDQQEMLASKMLYNFETKKAKVWDSYVRDGETALLAGIAKMTNDSTYFASNCKLTTCTDPHPHFYFKVSKAKVLRDNMVVFGPAHLVVLGLPLPVGLPFGFFPQKKGNRSGILPPEPGLSPTQGFFIRNGGYHWSVSEHLGISFLGDIYTSGSFKAGVSSQYVTRYKYNGNLSLSYSQFNMGDKEATNFYKQPDFRIVWVHNQDPKARPGLTFSANVDAGTSGYLRNNAFGNISNLQKNTMNSRIQLTKTLGKWGTLGMSAGHTQNTSTRKFDVSIPDVTFNVQRFYPLKRKVQIGEERWFEKIGVSYTTNLVNQINSFDSVIFKQSPFNYMKSGMSHNIPVSTSFKLAKSTSKNPLKFITLSPTLTFNERWNLTTTEKTWNSTSKKIDTTINHGFFTNRDYAFNTSATTILYGMYTFKGKLKAIRHQVTPMVNYVFNPDFSDPIYGYYKSVQVDSAGKTAKYSIFEQSLKGGPGAGKSNALNFSISNVLEGKVFSKKDTVTHEKKIKLIDFLGINGGYNFAAKEFKWSNLRVDARTNFSNGFSIQGNASFDPYMRDSSGVRINTLHFDSDGKIAKLSSGNLTFSGSYHSKKRSWDSNQGTEEERQAVNQNRNMFIDFEVPLNVSYNYILYYTAPTKPTDKAIITQTFTLMGDVSLTRKLKLGVQSGYDFTNKKITLTQFNFYYDLHCWDVSLTLVPFGTNKSYMFTLKPKSGLLSDLKITRNRYFTDWN